MKTPLNNAILQSNIDFNGFSIVNAGSTVGYANVKLPPYNAVGDGVTDDSAAIQAAINAAYEVGGGTVFFPKGIYLCNGPFDATTNSVLKFPYRPLQVSAGVWNNPVTIELLGETPTTVAAVPFPASQGSIIKCTKTGTGTAPAILAAYSYIGKAVASNYITAFSYIQPVIRNLLFQTGVDPSIFGVRLDAAVMAIVEDCAIETGDGGAPAPTEPTHGTVGLFMPTFYNFGNYLDRTWVAGFDTGIVAADHFRSPRSEVLNCHVAYEFLSTIQFGWGNLGVDHCNTCIKFTSIYPTFPRYPCDFTIDVEQIDTGWQTPTASSDILDSSNVGSGEIRYFLSQLGSGHKRIGVTGGSNLRLVDTYNAYEALTVATLPTGILGRTAFVTDGTASLAWGATVTGGGSTKYFVGFNGTNWTVIGK
jgi:hypothetical protein